TSAQNISSHLSKLVNAELLSVEKQGRHKYYKIAGQDVASAVEGIANLVSKDKRRELSSHGSGAKYCRTCYDHLAGKIGVEITEKLLSAGYIRLENKAFAVTEEGNTFFNNFGIDIPALKKMRRTFAKPCLDWSERKHHISGSLGASLLNRMLELDWIRRTAGSRAVVITSEGRKGLFEKLKINVHE
ncbi:MAG TPA: helix-turn-helix domain-containing protein, partial [Flavobacterium sp.]|nr:helix-turn-helix domain-containing protein [Flavobacterium sp.]